MQLRRNPELPEDHQVVGEDPETSFVQTPGIRTGTKCGPELPLVLREGAFDVDSVAVDAGEESAAQLATILGLRPAPFPTLIHGDHGLSNAQNFAAEGVVPLAVVGTVGEHPIQGQYLGRGEDGGQELGSVVRRAAADLARRPQVRGGVADDSELGVAPSAEIYSAWFSTEVMKAGPPSFQPGRVDRPLGVKIDQAALMCEGEYSVQQSGESPFFRRRFSAFSRVVQ